MSKQAENNKNGRYTAHQCRLNQEIMLYVVVPNCMGNTD